MLKITPLKDFIVLELPANSESRIIQTEDHDKTQVEGTKLLVVLVGPDCKSVKLGDRLIVDFNNAMIPLTIEKRQIFVTREENVCAVIRNDKLHSDVNRS